MRPRIAAAVALAAALALLAARPARADFDDAQWRYRKLIELPVGVAPDSPVEVVLDAEVYALARPDLADLRIADSEGTVVPYLLEVSRGARDRRSLSASIEDKGYVAGKHTSFVADLGAGGLMHNQVVIETPEQDFSRTAVLETSGDRRTWATVAEAEIYSFRANERTVARDTSISYVDSSARYLRVTISDGGAGPFDVTGVTVAYDRQTASRETRWPVLMQGAVEDAERRITVVELDTGVPGLPVHRLAVDVEDSNFDRAATVLASDDRETWRAVQPRARIFSYDTPRFTGSRLSIRFAETRARHYRLLIHNGDDAPLRVRDASVWGIQRRLLFIADPSAAYRLFYGNDEARRPGYDVGRTLAYLDTENPPIAQLGPSLDNPLFTPTPTPPTPVSERLPWLLPTAIAGAGVVVGLILLAILRKAKAVLPPPPE